MGAVVLLRLCNQLTVLAPSRVEDIVGIKVSGFALSVIKKALVEPQIGMSILYLSDFLHPPVEARRVFIVGLSPGSQCTGSNTEHGEPIFVWVDDSTDPVWRGFNRRSYSSART